MNHQGILVVVSGFSGAGKGTIMKELTHYPYLQPPELQEREKQTEKNTFSLQKSSLKKCVMSGSWSSMPSM